MDQRLFQPPWREQGLSFLVCYCLPLQWQPQVGVKEAGTTVEPRSTAIWPRKRAPAAGESPYFIASQTHTFPTF